MLKGLRQCGHDCLFGVTPISLPLEELYTYQNRPSHDDIGLNETLPEKFLKNF